jgi:regulatory protein
MALAHGSRAAKKPKSCHDRALGLLAVRMRSRRELGDRLARAGFDRTEVADEIERLERVGLIDDDRFAEEYARHASEVKRSGTRAIASALFAKGVERATVDRVLAERNEDEESRAEELARSRGVRMRGLPTATAYQRLASLLARRGYEPSVARQAARQALDVAGDDPGAVD